MAPPRMHPPVTSPRRRSCAERQVHAATSAASTNGIGRRSARVRTAAPMDSPPSAKSQARPRRAATANSAKASVSQNAPSGSEICSPDARISGGEKPTTAAGAPPPPAPPPHPPMTAGGGARPPQGGGRGPEGGGESGRPARGGARD